jgi:ribosomal protein S18 acetylase RimI-like enzyme
MINIHKVENSEQKSIICRKILDDLPMWFGIPESTNEYCENVKLYDFYSIELEKENIGFVSIKKNNDYVAEIYVLGILQKYHRKKYGELVLKYIFQELAKTSTRYVEVKTLDESRESDEYMKTRLFYKKMGFIPLDVLHNEWGRANPCLILIKDLRN